MTHKTYYLALYMKICLSPKLEYYATILLKGDYGLDQSCSNGEAEYWSSSKYVPKLESTEFTEELDEK